MAMDSALGISAMAFGTSIFLARYYLQRRTQSTLDKASLLALRDRHTSFAVSVSYRNTDPLLIVRGHGCRLVDENGVEYLDTRNNVAHCGHGHPCIVAAIQQQVAALNTNTRYLHPNMARLAEALSNKLPDPLSIVFFCNSGSEANDLALRLARASTSAAGMIVVEGGYHGHTLACLDVSPYKYDHSGEFVESPPATIAVPAPNTYRGPHRDPATAGAAYAEYVEQACRQLSERGLGVRGMIVEGGMSVAGVILPPPGYLRRCVDAVHAAGGLYIADEVQTGLGRLGSSYWAFEHGQGTQDPAVVPDIVTIGKPFGNGMPLATIVTTPTVAKAFEDCGVEYFNTFAGNPVSCAAGLAVLQVIEEEQLQEHALAMGEYLQDRLRQLQLPIIGDIRGSGLFLGIELVRSPSTLEPATEETSFLCSVLKSKYHILTSIDGQHDNVLVIKPPMVFARTDADYLIDSLERAITKDLPAAGDVRRLGKTPT